ncbi:NADH-quinone oxidoreductase subunit J [Flavobacterium sp.]|uniref:NADH-quinone oxidoreductase subunit J family protein n=1 Tax=Flavobacterium sp. TaxID=239 RepID=UPI0025BDE37B|nr:NADH-quinone oxidoreductase subunit J [Flavobacterium sp.]
MLEIIFYILSAITLGTAFLTVFSKNPIHSAIYLVVCFFSLAGHYVLFNAQFLAIVHVIVYAGAIMVLLLFTLMLMNLNKEDEVSKPKWVSFAALISACILGVVLIAALKSAEPEVMDYANTGEDFQSIKRLGEVLLDEYQVPFEFASVLLLVSMIGAVLISKKEEKI